MDLGIKGRVALVAASSRGLGREVARRLGEEGARLSICARGNEALAETASQFRRSGVDVLDQVCDLTVEQQATALVKRTVDHFGALDILVTNSGGPPPGEFLEHDTARWRSAVDLNLLSAVHLCREAVPQMVKRRWGRIVMMTSISVKQPLDGLVLSNSVRAAVVGLGKTLANELGKHGVLVNAVCPGYFLTDRVKELAHQYAIKTGGKPDQLLNQWAAQNALGRVGNPEEFGSLVAFLCSERASYISGATLAIDGGLCRSLL